METLKRMTESEYKTAIARIVSSGYGYQALNDLIHNMKARDDLAMRFMADADSTITAILKICNSGQTHQQKVKAVKALSESCVQTLAGKVRS